MNPAAPGGTLYSLLEPLNCLYVYGEKGEKDQGEKGLQEGL